MPPVAFGKNRRVVPPPTSDELLDPKIGPHDTVLRKAQNFGSMRFPVEATTCSGVEFRSKVVDPRYPATAGEIVRPGVQAEAPAFEQLEFVVINLAII